MSRKIVVHDEARFDVMDIAYSMAENSIEVSDRFVEAVGAAYEQLSAMPGMGTLRDYNNPELTGMRMWPVSGFNKHLIFYRATDTELQVMRVLNGSRDLDTLFKSDDS